MNVRCTFTNVWMNLSHHGEKSIVLQMLLVYEIVILLQNTPGSRDPY